MPSIFARARTTSTKNTTKAGLDVGDAGADEFGRVQSRHAPPPTPNKDRKAKDDKRVRAQSTTDRRRAASAAAYSTAGGETSFDGDGAMQLEDGYLPTQLVGPPEDGHQTYGYLSHESHVILGLEDVTRLVEVVADELGARGVLFALHPLVLYSPIHIALKERYIIVDKTTNPLSVDHLYDLFLWTLRPLFCGRVLTFNRTCSCSVRDLSF